MFSFGDITPKSKANDHIFMIFECLKNQVLGKKDTVFFFASTTWLIISSIRADKKNQKIDNHNEVFMWQKQKSIPSSPIQLPYFCLI